MGHFYRLCDYRHRYFFCKLMKALKVDKVFLGIVGALVVVGLFVFISASLGILAKNETKFYGVLTSQLMGLGAGIVAGYIAFRIPYTFWKKYSLYLFIGSLILTFLVFVPGLGFSHGGAQRWISLGFISFQPAEFLKLSFLMYAAAWLSYIKNKIHDARFSVMPFLGMLLVIALVLLRQPDTKSLILIFACGIVMFFVSGLNLKYLAWIVGIGIIGFAVLVMFKPYLLERVKTFMDPSHDPRGSSYQIQQSLIAIGSGGIFGRGFGQSIEKFSYLPEPQGDSIFAVVGEEFGFIGTVTIVVLFVAFALRGLRIANRAPDMFSRLLVTGIVILFITQSFLNIAALVGIFPLTGVPLVFVSHGGTSLMFALAGIGIILHISQFQKSGHLALKEKS